MANRISNGDIMTTLSKVLENQGRTEEKIDYVTRLAEKTNGRVTKVEDWKNALQAVEAYKKDNPTQSINAPNATTVVVRSRWFENEKLVGAVVAVLLALAGVIGFIAGGPR